MRTTTALLEQDLQVVLRGSDISDLQRLVRRVPVSDHVIDYAVRLVRATRYSLDGSALEYIKDWVSWGAGPRASQYLILGAKTRAVLDNRPTPSVEDVREVAKPVMRHRIVTSFNAEADGVTAEHIIGRLIEDVKEK